MKKVVYFEAEDGTQWKTEAEAVRRDEYKEEAKVLDVALGEALKPHRLAMHKATRGVYAMDYKAFEALQARYPDVSSFPTMSSRLQIAAS